MEMNANSHLDTAQKATSHVIRTMEGLEEKVAFEAVLTYLS